MQKNTKKILEELQEQYNYHLSEAEKLKQAITILSSVDSITLPSITSDYPENGSWAERILYSLSQVKQPAYVLDVVDYMRDKEPIGSRLITTVSQYLPDLFQKGKVTREKVGNKYRYSLKEVTPTANRG